MTKSIKQKKEQKKDFKKKKIKVGKVLRKPENETKTEFKARKLIIKEQLAECPEFEIVHRRTLSIKESLGRLTHTNDHVRQDAMKRLKGSIVAQSRSELAPHLCNLIKGVAPCILDTDKIVRKAAVENIKVLVKKIGNAVEPYFKILSSYVTCAMVHINVNVRVDSLLIMDVLINQLPTLIAKSGDKLLNTYLSLISKRMRGAAGKASAAPEPTSKSFSFDPTCETSTLSWRTKFLQSLSRYLGAVLCEQHKIKKNLPKSLWHHSLRCVFLNDSDLSPSLQILTNESALENFCCRLTPILQTMWIDVLAEVKDIEDNPLPVTGAKVLDCILTLMNQMIEMIDMVPKKTNQPTWFSETVHAAFRTKLLSGFPYSVITQPDQSPYPIVDVNLRMAVFAMYFSDCTTQVRRKMMQYITGVLKDDELDGKYQMDKLATIVCNLMATGGEKDQLHHERLLEAALVCFNRQRMGSKKIPLMLQIPLQSTDHKCSHLRGTDVTVEWMDAVLQQYMKAPMSELYDMLIQLKLRAMPGIKNICSKYATQTRARPSLEQTDEER